MKLKALRNGILEILNKKIEFSEIWIAPIAFGFLSVMGLISSPWSQNYLFDHLLTSFYFVIVVWMPGVMLARAFGYKGSLSFAIGIGLGTALTLTNLCLNIYFKLPEITLWLPILLSILQISGAAQKVHICKISVADALSIFSLVFFLCLYRFLIMDQGNNLAERGPITLWPDIAWFMGNAAALKNQIRPMDFRLLGQPLAYHFATYQFAAAISKATGAELIHLLTRSLPIIFVSNLVPLIFLTARSFSAKTSSALVTAMLALYCAPPFYPSSFGSMLDTTLNLFSSQSITFGLVFMMIIILTVDHMIQKRSEILWSVLNLSILFFLLAATKVSVAAVIGMGLGLTFIYLSIKERTSSWFIYSVIPGFFCILGYLFTNVREGLPSNVQNIKFAFPNSITASFLTAPTFGSMRVWIEFLNHHGFEWLSYLIFVPLVGLLRYAPWFMSLNLVNNKRPIRILLLVSFLIAILWTFCFEIEGGNIHFFQPGLICLSLLAGIWFEFRLNTRTLLFLVVFLLSLLPVWKDREFETFHGKINGKDFLFETELDTNLIKAYRYIRSGSEVSDIVASPFTSLSSAPDRYKRMYFFASAYTERQILIEGWAFTIESLMDIKSPKFLHLMDIRDKIYDSASLWSQILNTDELSKLRWIIWDERTLGVVTGSKTDGWAIDFQSGPVTVWRKTRTH